MRYHKRSLGRESEDGGGGATSTMTFGIGILVATMS